MKSCGHRALRLVTHTNPYRQGYLDNGTYVFDGVDGWHCLRHDCQDIGDKDDR